MLGDQIEVSILRFGSGQGVAEQEVHASVDIHFCVYFRLQKEVPKRQVLINVEILSLPAFLNHCHF